MRVRGTNKRGDTPRPDKGGSLLFFRRLLRYVLMQRRWLIAAITCIVILAVSYSVGIGTFLPVLQIMLNEEGVPTWVNRSVTEKRLGGVRLTTFTRLERPRADVPAEYDYSAMLLGKPPERSDLRNHAFADDLLIAIDGRRVPAGALFGWIADQPDGARFRLTIRSMDGSTRDAEVEVGPVALHWRIGHRLANLLPSGNTREERLRSLVYILSVLVAISFVQNVSRFFGEYLVGLVAARTLVSLRREMYRKVLRLPLSFFAQRGTSDVMSRFTNDSQDIYRGLTFVFAQTIREPLKSVGVFVLAMMLAPRITLMAVVVAPAVLGLIRYFGKIVRRANRRLLQGYSRMLGALEGALVGVRVVKGYNMERFERRHLFGIDWTMLRHQLRIEMVDALTSPSFEVLGMVAGAAATVWFYSEMLAGRLDAAGFLTMVLCLIGIFDPLRKLSNLYTRIQRANAAAERVFEIIDLPVEEDLSAGARPRLPPFEREIVFEQVTFTYPGADRPAVADFSLTVRRGERIALVGPNGSGKTTIMSLLARFFEPQRGRILFDGRNMAEYSIDSLRRQISLVTQDTVLFGVTVRENIAYGDERLLRRMTMQARHPQRAYPWSDGMARIEEAARAAYADEFIRELPQGYETLIGEHGATLSGGQKQRLTIARAILRNAPILVFDEATSQIDADSENKIHRAVEAFLADRTGFIIAHRFSTILQADRIVVMDAGRIVDVGRHEDLLARCSLYRTLFETQLISAPTSGSPGIAGA